MRKSTRVTTQRVRDVRHRHATFLIAASSVVCHVNVAAQDASALPTGGAIAAGEGHIEQRGNQLIVTQDGDRLITNWNSFSIGADAAVRFAQPGADAVALNRVLGADPSRIQGRLSADGKVFLLNPNGVLFGNSAQVDVGGLFASTMDIADGDFLAGRYTFTQSADKPSAAVTNLGAVRATRDGFVVLAAPEVTNAGSISTPLGTTSLAAGSRVTLAMGESGLLGVSVDGAALQAAARNRGTLQADGGQVAIQVNASALGSLVLEPEGVIQARWIAHRDGRVFLDGGASGNTLISGRIDASRAAPDARGGSVSVLGQNVALLAGSRIDASGEAGGGKVLVGGNWQGAGPERNAEAVVMDASARIDADGAGHGDGGTVVLWSDQYTDFQGSISARGGALGGNGGQVETSSHALLQAFGSVDAAATLGRAGQWLLDPNNVTISTSATSSGSFNAGNPNLFTPTAGINSNVSNATINSSLNAGTSVTITTASAGFIAAGDITVSAPITKSAGGDATLTLRANRNITLDSGSAITSTSGRLGVVLNPRAADPALTGTAMGQVALSSGIQTNGGDLTIYGGDAPGGYAFNGGSLLTPGISTSPNVVLDARGAVGVGGSISLYGRAGSANGIELASGTQLLTQGTGAITVRGEVASTGLGGSGLQLNGNVTIGAQQGALNLTGQGSGAAPGLSFGSGSFSTTTGAINFSGSNSGLNTGLLKLPGTATIASSSGNITLAGSVSTALSTAGVQIGSGSLGITTGGAISVSSTGGALSPTLLVDGSLSLQAGTGITVTATGGANATAISTSNTSTFSTATGNISLTADAAINNTAALVAVAGNVNATAGTSLTLGAVSAAAGTITATAGGAADLGALTANAATVSAGADLALASFTKPVTAVADSALNLRAAGNISVNGNIAATLGAGRLDTTISSRYTDAAAGTIHVGNITTRGGNITLGGGSANGDGFAAGALLTSAINLFPNAVLDAGGGSIALRARTSATSAVPAMMLPGSAQLLTSGAGNIDITGTNLLPSVNVYGLVLGDGLVLTSASGNINVTGNTVSNLLGVGTGVGLSFWGGTFTSGTGNITFNGSGYNDAGILKVIGLTPTNFVSASGNLTLNGTSNGNSIAGIMIDNTSPLNMTTGGTGAINWTGTGGSTLNRGVQASILIGSALNLAPVLNLSAGSGGLNINGNGSGATYGLFDYGSASLFSSTGGLNITSNASLNLPAGLSSSTSINLVSNAGSIVTGALTSASNITLQAAGTLTSNANITSTGGGTIRLRAGALNYTGLASSSGALVIEPISAASSIGIGTTGTLQLASSMFSGGTRNFADGFGSITIGRADGSGAVALGNVTFTDPVTLLAPSLGGSLSLGGNVVNTAGGLTARVGGNITLGSAGGISTAGAGADIVLSTEGIGSFIDNSASATPLVSAGGRWLVYTSTPASTVLGSTILASGNAAVWNGTWATLAPGSVAAGNRFIFNYSPTVSLATSSVGKVYGDNAAAGVQAAVSAAWDASLTAQNGWGTAFTALSASDLLSGNGVATTSAGAGVGANVGVYPILFSATPSLLGGFSASYQATGSLTVTPRPITVSMLPGLTKVYGADDPLGLATSLTVSAGSLVNGHVLGGSIGRVGGESVGLYAFTQGSLGIADGNGGNNYLLSFNGASNPFAITAAPLTVSLGSQVKVYGNADPLLGSLSPAVTGVVNRAVRDINGHFTTLDDTGQVSVNVTGLTRATGENVGTYAYTGVQLSTPVGSAAANYSVHGTVAGNPTLSITPRPITISARADAKVYDGGVTSSLLPQLTGGNLVFGDTLTGLTQLFDSRNAGSRTLAVSGYALVDGNAGNNYLVTTQTALGNITPRLLTTSVSVDHKVYDGTLAATGTFGPLVNAISGDSVGLAGGATLSFLDRNVGSGKSVIAGGLALSGTDAGNYTINAPLGLTANITPRAVALVGISANDKVYDGTPNTTFTGGAVAGVLGLDAVVLVNGTAAFRDKHVGTNKQIDLANFSLTGLDALNYSLTLPSGLTASVTPATLSILGTLATDRIYNGTTTANLDSTASLLSGVHVGDDVNLLRASASGAFADKNAGTAKAVAVTGFGISGADAHNYTLNQPVGVTASITPRLLPVGGVWAEDKVFDSTTTATLNNSNAYLSGLIVGDSVALDTSAATGTFASANAGTGIAVTASGYAINGLDAGNYLLQQPLGLAAYIAQAALGVNNLLVTGITAASREYDGTTLASLDTSGAALNGVLGGAANVSLVTSGAVGTFADPNVGVNKTVTITGFTLNGADAGNYILNPVATTLATILPRALTVVGVVAANRTYDGTVNAQLTGGTLSSNVIAGDVVTLTGSASGVFDTKHVGNGKAISVNGFGLVGVDAGNYALTQPTGVTGSVTAAQLSLGGLTANDKVYDGTLAATLSGGALVGVLGSDVVTFGGGGGVFADKNVGNNKSVSVNGYVLGGADAGNYLLQQPTGLTADITPRVAAVVGLHANDKTYDATTAATLTGTAALGGTVSGDVLNLTGTGIASFLDKNVGNDKAVVVGGLTLVGADAHNYTLALPTGFTADITPAALALSGVVAGDKVYDATVGASLSGGTLTGVLGHDAVGFGAGAGVFADKNVGRHKAVAASGFTLSGADAGNYVLSQPLGIVASITPASLALSGVSAQSRVYNATTAATLSGGTLGGILGGDNVGLAGGNAVFLDENVGNGKTVLVNGYTLAGVDAGNYRVTGPATLSANITPASLSISAVADSRVYDGTASSTAAPVIAGLLGSDSATATQAFATRNAGSSVGLAVSGFSIIDGNGGANYAVTLGTSSGSITPRQATVSGITADDKVYDGSTVATVRLGRATLGNVIMGDSVTLGATATGAFNNRNVGNGKPVTISGLALTGADAANYALAAATGVTADITPATLTITAVADSKTFDGSTVSTGSPLVTGLQGTDSVSASQTFGSAGIGTGNTLTPGAIVNDGNGGANYTVTLVSSGGGSITPPPGQSGGDGTDPGFTPVGWRSAGGGMPTTDGTPVLPTVDGTPPDDEEEEPGLLVLTYAPGIATGGHVGGAADLPIIGAITTGPGTVQAGPVNFPAAGTGGAGTSPVREGDTYSNVHSDGTVTTTTVAGLDADTIRFVTPERALTARLEFPVADGPTIIGRASVDIAGGQVTVSFVDATGTLPPSTAESLRELDTRMRAADGQDVAFEIDISTDELDITPENDLAAAILGPQRDLALLKLIVGQATVDAIADMGATGIQAMRLTR